jgi:hypothetical protein
MVGQTETRKRSLLKFAAVAGAGFAGGLIVPSAFAAESRKKEPDRKAEVTPPEDLMREHGLLDRLLLVYEAGIRKLVSNEDFDPVVIVSAAEIVRDFIENYHEKSEEEAVFPRFKKAGKMVSLVDTLLTQHQAGRHVTEAILQTAPVAVTMMVTESDLLVQSSHSSTCIGPMPHARIRISFQCSEVWSPPMSMTRWPKISRRRNISFLEATVSK